MPAAGSLQSLECACSSDTPEFGVVSNLNRHLRQNIARRSATGVVFATMVPQPHLPS